ncbi:hypothetical protein [Actinoplanes sp. NPDC049265]|uniref:hypothetical protein n=1 Tax=Actinoplanes sp. NPDC049265 TaxID=3363902 RepID=UPI00371573C8
MTRKHIGPEFHVCIGTRLADGTELHDVYVGGRCPLDGGGARYPLGRRLGRAWKQEGYGWVAAPLALPDSGPDSWSAEVSRSVRHFRTRKDACLFLYGWASGLGALKTRDAVRELWPRVAAA